MLYPFWISATSTNSSASCAVRGIDIREAYEIELALAAHVREHEQLFLERYRAVSSGLHQAEIHEVQTLHSERVEVRLDSFAQLVGPLRGENASRGVATRADLGHQLEIVRVRIAAPGGSGR